MTRKEPSGKAVTKASIGLSSDPTAFTLNLAFLGEYKREGREEDRRRARGGQERVTLCQCCSWV